MKNNHNIIEERTFELVQITGTDIPNADFTQKVMQSVLQENQIKSAKVKFNLAWVIRLSASFVILTGACACVIIFHLTLIADKTVSFIQESIQSLYGSFLTFLSQLKNTTLQPSIQICFLAIFLLLIIEGIVSRARHSI